MPDAVRGAAALAALLLLPGLLVVRAPWTAVPFLSLFFWIASWWWLPSLARERLLTGALVGFGLVLLLRLARLDATRPSWPSLVALAAAGLRGATGLVAGASPSASSLDATAAQLMVWHDSLPATYMPMTEAGSFGAHAHGFAALAADVALLSGLRVPLAVALAAAAARGLAWLALFAALSRWLAPRPAAISVAGAAVAVGLLETVTGPADPAGSLAAAFVVLAAGLLVRGRTRSGAVAAGALGGTAVMTGSWVAGAALAAVAAAVLLSPPAQGEDPPRRRVAIAAAALAATAAPYLVRVAAALVRG